MSSILDRVSLERFGPKDACVGMVSMPWPREFAGKARVDHPTSCSQPVGWWERDKLARRSVVYVVGNQPVPEKLGLTTAPAPAEMLGPSRWTIDAVVTREKLDFTARPFTNISGLRGVPYHETTAVEFELHLGYGGRKLALQFVASGPDGEVKPGRVYPWQNVMVDRLWRQGAAEGVRVGGIIYNGDTYLWVDLHLVLFSNGVVSASAHLVNTKLHLFGYDFQGLPALVIRSIDGPALRVPDATLPRDGRRFDLGALKLNLETANALCGEEFPGRLSGWGNGAVAWKPFPRTFNPQHHEAPAFEWPAGFARTLRFEMSLGDAPPAVARYRVPAWWYGLAGEFWSEGVLPVKGSLGGLALESANVARGWMARDRFDAGNALYANDGFLGTGLLRQFYLTGDETLFRDGLDYCHYWADIAVDHQDFSIHQWIGGWPWKTCAYSKFRDVLMGYLETGDPHLLETAENCADAYWMWYRANWPRRTQGRDNFEVGGWALLRRFTRSQRSIERTREFVRMIGSLLESRGQVGGQMGAGPHPGYISSLYMTGVTLVSLAEVGFAEVEEGCLDRAKQARKLFETLDTRFQLRDVEMFPSNYGVPVVWDPKHNSIWVNLGCHAYTAWARLTHEDARTTAGLARIAQSELPPFTQWAGSNRIGDNLLLPPTHDALLLGATLTPDRGGVELRPLGSPEVWPASQTVLTPWGELHIACDAKSRTLTFTSNAKFPVTLHHCGKTQTSNSTGALNV